MDYEFSTDKNEQPTAKFSMGHEAIGLWLSEEMGNNQKAITALLDKIRQIEQNTINDYNLQGREFQLRLNWDQAEVLALTLNIDVNEELPEDTDLYDQELYAECGLQDFKKAMLGWQSFVYSTIV